ncbi:MAG TPA: glycosyltransferase family 39 protein [Candidatus Eremiobacteraceae bacterium]|nr:glycosyltransferase family 39 protein [Candidatus Eremiobacteraceae bacterium]
MRVALRRQAALFAILLLALLLRLYGIHNPILDHPGWRQGDEAAIARNFAQLHDNILYPQVDYDGPPPNYAELELQIVPFAAAQMYRVFGVHETFARIIVVAFSLAEILLLYFFGREIFSHRAGLIAAVAYAVAPGAVYYGRTITPDTDMVFFMTGALYFWWRFCDGRKPIDFAAATIFGALAWLAKPVALLALVPILAIALARRGLRGTLTDWSPYAFVVLTCVPLYLYFHHLSAIAEWHWATGITSLHVIPALNTALSSPGGLGTSILGALALLRMLSTTILGPVLFALGVGAWFALPRDGRSGLRVWFFGAWLVAFAVYAFAVVNVERVDYYLLPALPLAALLAAGALDNIAATLGLSTSALSAAGGIVAVFVTAYANMLEVHPYYTWSRPVYAAAGELDRRLDPNTLVIMGHYDPSVLYTIGRKGWEEDALAWTVHDTQSAIRKGAAYFIGVEVPRLKANRPLYSYLQRFARVPVSSGWQVYDLRKPAHLLGDL